MYLMYIMYIMYIMYANVGFPAKNKVKMSIVADYGSFTDTRTHLKDVFDATSRGRIVTVGRDGELSAVVPVDRLRSYFFGAVSPRVTIASEEGRTVALMEGRPFVSEGATVDDALSDLVLSLREYAEDWEERLQRVPNHESNWALVQLVKISTDEQLVDWFESGGE